MFWFIRLPHHSRCNTRHRWDLPSRNADPRSSVGNNAAQGVDHGSCSLLPWLSSCSLQAPKKRKVPRSSSPNLDTLPIPQLSPTTFVGNKSATSTYVLLLANESTASATLAATSSFESDKLFTMSPLHLGLRVLRWPRRRCAHVCPSPSCRRMGGTISHARVDPLATG